MNTLRRKISLLTILVLGLIQTVAAADKASTAFRLTVELRDGSRIIGKSKQDHLEFRSPILGDINLPMEKVRLIENTAGTNLVKLTTTNNDTMTVEFTTKDLQVETAYGDVKLPPAMIKRILISRRGGKGRPTDGLIGLWSGEGNGVDSANGNNGNLLNVTFTDGVAGQAFSFAPDNYPWGTYVGLQIPDQPAFALTGSLTIEGWVRPRGDGYIIMCRGDHRPGLDPYTLSMQGNHDLRFQICDNDNNSDVVDTSLPYGQWTHVAATLDGDAKTISLYTNGVLAAQAGTHVKPIGALIPEMSPGLGIGNINDGGNNFPFVGDIDEIALYGRALSPDEINAIYADNAANAAGRAELRPKRNQGVRPLFRNSF